MRSLYVLAAAIILAVVHAVAVAGASLVPNATRLAVPPDRPVHLTIVYTGEAPRPGCSVAGVETGEGHGLFATVESASVESRKVSVTVSVQGSYDGERGDVYFVKSVVLSCNGSTVRLEAEPVYLLPLKVVAVSLQYFIDKAEVMLDNPRFPSFTGYLRGPVRLIVYLSDRPEPPAKVRVVVTANPSFRVERETVASSPEVVFNLDSVPYTDIHYTVYINGIEAASGEKRIGYAALYTLQVPYVTQGEGGKLYLVVGAGIAAGIDGSAIDCTFTCTSGCSGSARVFTATVGETATARIPAKDYEAKGTVACTVTILGRSARFTLGFETGGAPKYGFMITVLTLYAGGALFGIGVALLVYGLVSGEVEAARHGILLSAAGGLIPLMPALALMVSKMVVMAGFPDPIGVSTAPPTSYPEMFDKAAEYLASKAQEVKSSIDTAIGVIGGLTGVFGALSLVTAGGTSGIAKQLAQVLFVLLLANAATSAMAALFPILVTAIFALAVAAVVASALGGFVGGVPRVPFAVIAVTAVSVYLMPSIIEAVWRTGEESTFIHIGSFTIPNPFGLIVATFIEVLLLVTIFTSLLMTVVRHIAGG